MEKNSWLEKLRNRWGLKNIFQVIIILIVFACTGFTVLFIKKPILYVLQIDEGSSSWLQNFLYFLLILPAYQVLLLMYGFVFGQFKFFWEFEKKMFKRMGRRFVK